MAHMLRWRATNEVDLDDYDIDMVMSCMILLLLLRNDFVSFYFCIKKLSHLLK